MSQLRTFEEIPVEKKIPSSSRILEMLGKQDLIKERYTTTQQPYSGSSIATSGGTSKVQHKIYNNADYADFNTMYLMFDVTSTVVGPDVLDNLQYDDNILSLFNVYRGMVNDKLVEEITNFNLYVNLLTYATMSKSNYESAASFQGCYRHSGYLNTGGPIGALVVAATGITALTLTNPSNFGSGVPFTPVATNGLSPNDVLANACTRATTSYTVPLAGFIGLASLEKFFPLRNVASVSLEFFLQPVGGCVYNNRFPSGTPILPAFPASLVVSVTNQALVIDMVKMADAYYELMDQELIDPAGIGCSFVINTVECSTGTIPVAGGQKTLLISKGTKYLKSIWTVQQPTAWAGNYAVPSNSLFVPMGYSSHQFVCNSRRYPQLKCQGLPQAFQELQKSTNKFASIVGDSVITKQKYSLDAAAGVVTAANSLGCFIIGGNFEQVIESGVQLQGLNTETAGFNIQLEITNNPGVATSVYSFVHFAKVLKLGAGSVAVEN